jgi:general secretion pathway protein I
LIEILVAFVILSITMTVVMRVVSDSMRSLSTADTYSTAALAGESLLARIGVDAPLEPGERRGDLGNGLTWRQVVKPVDENGEMNTLRLPLRPLEVDIEVTWQEHGHEQSLLLTTLRLVAQR